MALQSSGAISLADIQTEFGGTNPIGLNEYYGAATGVPASGTISIDDFYGTSSFQAMSASGGTVTTSGSYKYHTFTGSGTFTISDIGSGAYAGKIDYLVVAGGGGGSQDRCGGGGAGGYRSIENTTVSTGSFTVTIGAGGVKNNPSSNGSNSSFNGTTSIGGGRGAQTNSYNGGSGGSGGGGGQTQSPGSGTAGQGNNGGYGGGAATGGGGGGGGGAGSVGGNFSSGVAGDGGSGLTWLNGTVYAAGGGGGCDSGGSGEGQGGSGGVGGRGQYGNYIVAATNPIANRGGGGGGGGGINGVISGQGTNGASGVVIIRYRNVA